METDFFIVRKFNIIIRKKNLIFQLRKIQFLYIFSTKIRKMSECTCLSVLLWKLKFIINCYISFVKILKNKRKTKNNELLKNFFLSTEFKHNNLNKRAQVDTTSYDDVLLITHPTQLEAIRIFSYFFSFSTKFKSKIT